MKLKLGGISYKHNYISQIEPEGKQKKKFLTIKYDEFRDQPSVG